jgi:hypothetical protein
MLASTVDGDRRFFTLTLGVCLLCVIAMMVIVMMHAERPTVERVPGASTLLPCADGSSGVHFIGDLEPEF